MDIWHVNYIYITFIYTLPITFINFEFFNQINYILFIFVPFDTQYSHTWLKNFRTSYLLI